MKWTIAYTKKALDELEGIYDYIANSLIEPNIAKSLIDLHNHGDSWS